MSNTVAVTRASRYGQFRPHKLRATGGFSDVYIARDNNGQTVALKVYRSLSNDSSNSMERFRREKSILERVGTRRVARLIDADLNAIPPWIASEFIEGPTLREAVDQSGPFEIGLVLSVMALLSETLEELHELGIAHRDINPNNIVLSKDGPTLIDFGSAQLLATGQANYSRLSVGTPGYISPEQINGDPATLASDVYSFAKLAVFLIAGNTTDETWSQVPKFNRKQQEILQGCLSTNPLNRPSSSQLRETFTTDTDPIVLIQNFNYQTPELKKVPRKWATSLLLLMLALALLVGTAGVWRATSSNGVTSDDLVARLANEQRQYGDAGVELLTNFYDFGVFNTVTLPEVVDVFRDRRNHSTRDTGFLDFFRIFSENVVNSELVIYALPSASPPTFSELTSQSNAPRLIELSGFGIDISDRISRLQSELVKADCALDVPEQVSIDFGLRRIRHVAAAPVCVEILKTHQVAYAIHDWYPDKNLLFELTGWVDIAILNPAEVLDSIRFPNDFKNPVARPTTAMGLSDMSSHSDRPSLIDGDYEDSAFFYVNLLVEIAPNASLNLDIDAPSNSPVHFSFTAYQEEADTSTAVAIPAGRLWAVNEHQLRFDNPESRPLVLSIEIDGSDTIPPTVSATTSLGAQREGWLRVSDLSFGIGELPFSSDSENRFMLPTALKYDGQTFMDSIMSVEFPVIVNWSASTSRELASAGFREYWSTVDTELREADLPHLQISSEGFSQQVDGSRGVSWISDPSFLSCGSPNTFSYSAVRTIQWSIFSECEIPDALQSGSFVRQVQASIIFRFIAYDGINDDDTESLVAYRGVFVPGTHQDLDYFRTLLIHLAKTDLPQTDAEDEDEPQE